MKITFQSSFPLVYTHVRWTNPNFWLVGWNLYSRSEISAAERKLKRPYNRNVSSPPTERDSSKTKFSSCCEINLNYIQNKRDRVREREREEEGEEKGCPIEKFSVLQLKSIVSSSKTKISSWCGKINKKIHWKISFSKFKIPSCCFHFKGRERVRHSKRQREKQRERLRERHKE